MTAVSGLPMDSPQLCDRAHRESRLVCRMLSAWAFCGEQALLLDAFRPTLLDGHISASGSSNCQETDKSGALIMSNCEVCSVLATAEGLNAMTA